MGSVGGDEAEDGRQEWREEKTREKPDPLQTQGRGNELCIMYPEFITSIP